MPIFELCLLDLYALMKYFLFCQVYFEFKNLVSFFSGISSWDSDRISATVGSGLYVEDDGERCIHRRML